MGRLQDLRQMVREGRIGFAMDEVMSGRHRFEPQLGPRGDHPFSFKVTWGPRDVRRWLDWRGDGFMTQALQGTVEAGGLCGPAPCAGVLELFYCTEHLIRYRFDFQARGTTCRFVGEKVNIRLWNFPVSHTTCFGRVTEVDSGRLVSTAILHFRMRTLPSFVASFRLA